MDSNKKSKRALPMALPLRDYERAFRVIHSVIGGADGTPETACVIFSCVGAYFLSKLYGIKSHVVAGAALFRVHPSADNIMVIGAMDENNRPCSTVERFHMWVESQTHVFDFQAPLFKNTLSAQSPGSPAVPARMFQRGIVEETDGSFDMVGDFALYPNPKLTHDLTEHFFDRQLNIDVLKVCEAWFRKPPAPISPTFSMMSEQGEVKTMALSPIRLDSAWGR